MGPVEQNRPCSPFTETFQTQPLLLPAALCHSRTALHLCSKSFSLCIALSKSGTLPRKNFTRPPPPPFKILFDSSTSSAAAQVPLGQLQASHTDTAGQLKIARQKHATALPTPLLATTDCTRTARSCGARVLALAPSSSSARELVEHSEHSARLVAARCLCRLNGLEPPPGHGVVAWLCPRRQSQSSGFGGR